MADAQLIDTVNALFALECGSLMQRIQECEPYIAPDAAEEAAQILDLVAEEGAHSAKLVDLLDRLDATPGPRGVQLAANEIQFNKPHALLPWLIADKKKLITAYERAAQLAAGEPAAADVLGQLLANHRNHQARLEELAGATA